ncbi:MAG: tetratricopeptide repeat protein, partial [Cyanobacteria bacterium J06555_13]
MLVWNVTVQTVAQLLKIAPLAFLMNGMPAWANIPVERHAIVQHKQSLPVADDANDLPPTRLYERARLLFRQGLKHVGDGQYPEALDNFETALGIYRELGDRTGEAALLNDIGNISRLQGRYAEALDHYQQSLVIKRELGDRTGEALTLYSIGIVHHVQGSHANALDYYQ